VDERGKHFRSSHGTREERSWEDGSRGLWEQEMWFYRFSHGVGLWEVLSMCVCV
jgi:hypothetical protein